MRAIKTWVLRTIAHHLARPRVLAWLRRRINGWGFLVDGKKVPWREYLSGREGAA